MSMLGLALVLLVLELGLIGAVLYQRSLSNPRLFRDPKALKPVNSKHAFFGAFNGLYDLLDRVPLLRRSGTANELDLLKALVLSAVPILAIELLINQPGWLVTVLSVDVLLLIVAGLLLLHPLLKKL